MRVADVDVTETPRGARISAQFVWEDKRRGRDSLYFLYRDTGADQVTTPGDALLAAALVPSLILGEDVLIEAPVSRRLHEATPAIVGYFTSRVRKWRPIDIDAPNADRSCLQPTEVAAAFSGGVDSFYTALQPRQTPISLLVTMLGLDYATLVPKLEPLMTRLARAAAELGKRHLVVESNAYVVGLDRLPWTGPRGIATLGSLVIAQALGVGSMIRRFHVPSAGARTAFEGTHPDLDHLWSTEALEVVHERQPQRLEKINAIATVPAVLETLHVCHRPRRQPGNCGMCDKCVGTALGLQLAGTIDRCQTLGRVTPSRIRATDIDKDWVPFFRQLQACTVDAHDRRAVGFALRKAVLRRPLRPVGRLLRRLGLRRGPR